MKYVFSLLLWWFVLMIFFPCLRPKTEPLKVPVITLYELPDGMTEGDVVMVKGHGKAELVGVIERTGELNVRRLEGTFKGFTTIVPRDAVKAIDPDSRRKAYRLD